MDITTEAEGIACRRDSAPMTTMTMAVEPACKAVPLAPTPRPVIVQGYRLPALRVTTTTVTELVFLSVRAEVAFLSTQQASAA